MSACCAAASAELALARAAQAPQPSALAPFARCEAGLWRLDLMVSGTRCAGCVNTVEQALRAFPAVRTARLHLGTGRLALAWAGELAAAETMIARLAELGYRAQPYDAHRLVAAARDQERELLRTMAVAGFAAGNIMLLSVAVWAGHVQGMGEATRTLLHWFSALIALPASFVALRPFWQSAWAALRHGRTNMDVPITLGVVLALLASLGQTAGGGEHAYFDAAVSLLFFLLLGRYLDARARGRARASAERLLALGAGTATLLESDGRTRPVAADRLSPGQRVIVAAGERLPADGRILDGHSALDTSLVTGESLPQPVTPGAQVWAGTVNLDGPLTVEVTGTGDGTLLAEIARMLDAAEQRKGRFVVLADRVARLYAPVVHLLALMSFLLWRFGLGAAWPDALMVAVAVLIVTCPCAIGLAVPAVQVVAAGTLMRRGILLKSATALERLAEIDMVVFDKTGTLTQGSPELARHDASPAELRLAASLALRSRHPLAVALARAVPDALPAGGVEEVKGAGLVATTPTGALRLGSRAFVGAPEDGDATAPELWLALPDGRRRRFTFDDPLRADAPLVIERLRAAGLELAILSGDREPTVAALARRLGIATWRSRCLPAEKCAALEELRRAGRRVLMVGDGLNDAPALVAAHASLSPSTAADLSQTKADAVFQGEALAPVPTVLQTARTVRHLVRQNLGLALAYNIVTVPVAMAGLLTPLLAAIFMSLSSLTVVGNALRAGWEGRGQ